MTTEERQDFIRLMFTLLESTGARTLTELHNGKVKAAITALKAFKEMPEADRDTASYLWDKLVGSRGAEVKSLRYHEEKVPRKGKGKIRVSFFPLFLP
jgi:hypothetical protein